MKEKKNKLEHICSNPKKFKKKFQGKEDVCYKSVCVSEEVYKKVIKMCPYMESDEKYFINFKGTNIFYAKCNYEVKNE